LIKTWSNFAELKVNPVAQHARVNGNVGWVIGQEEVGSTSRLKNGTAISSRPTIVTKSRGTNGCWSPIMRRNPHNSLSVVNPTNVAILGAPSNQLLASFWTDIAGVPATQVGGSFGVTAPKFAAAVAITGITNVNLQAGQTYFLVLSPGSADTIGGWNAALSSTGGMLINSGSGWTAFTGTSPAFDVSGTATPPFRNPPRQRWSLSGWRQLLLLDGPAAVSRGQFTQRFGLGQRKGSNPHHLTLG
jgi:hypothetical protein